MRPTSHRTQASTTSKVFLVSLLSFVISHATPFNYSKLVQTQTIAKSNKLEQVRQKLFNLNEADENGIYLLGLFDVHLKSSRPSGSQYAKSFTCGPIDVDSGETSSRRAQQNLWAFLWAIEQVNQDDTLLPGVRLGSLALDTCSSELQTSQQLANLLHGHHDDKLPRASQFAAMLADQRHWRSVEAAATIASAQGLPTFVTQTRSTKLNEPDRVTTQKPDLSGPGESIGQSHLIRQTDERMLGGLLGIGSMMTLPAGATGDSANVLQTTPAESGQELRLIKMLPGNEILADALASLCDHMKWDLISIVYEAGEPDLLDLHDELIRELLLRNTQLALDEPVTDEEDEIQAQAGIERLLTTLARKTQMGSRVVISLLGIRSARRVQAKLRELRRRASGDIDSSGLQLDPDSLRQLNSLQWVTITDREPYYSYATDSLGVIVVSGASSLMPEFANYHDQLKLVESSEARNHSIGREDDELDSWLRQPRNKWWPEYVRALVAKQRLNQGRPDELLLNECAKWFEPTASHINQRCKQLSLAKLAEMATPSAGINKQKQASKSSPANRFLAAGWDHNGMDVINSVLAAANGLESLRQTLCPNVTVGLCQEMRNLVAPPGNNSGDTPRSNPSLGELVHDELMKLNFQLADGQWFRLNQSPYTTSSTASAAAAMVERAKNQKSASNTSASASGGGEDDDGDLTLGLLASGFLPIAQESGRAQLETRLKFYNLRFLRSNRSIGFIKFAQFSLDEGIFWQEHPYSQALHYSSLPGNFSDVTPITSVKSSCTDESKCLMLSALMNGLAGEPQHSRSASRPGGGSSLQPLNEEQLAANFNSLFKLDHPLISGSNSTGPLHQDGARSDSAGGTVPLWVLLWEKLQGRVRSMVSPRAQFLSVPLSDPFETAAPNKSVQAPRKREFELLVLLPVHEAGNKSAATNFATCEDCCGQPAGSAHNFRLDEAHSFQQLAALAYAQQLVNGQLQASSISASRTSDHGSDDDQTKPENSTTTSRSETNRAWDELRPSSELAINVIDYCGQIDLVDGILSDYLEFHQAHTKWLKENGDDQHRSEAPQLVAVVDFDSQVAKVVDGTLGKSKLSSSLLHLTIARHVDHEQQKGQLQQKQQSQPQREPAIHHDHLRIDLLPDKAREIEVLVELIKSFPSWRLVHLIYTDSHDYRDEFVRRANEHNICVSKLIWIPKMDDGQPQRDQKEALERTRRVFQQELFDYSVERDPGHNKSLSDAGDLSSTRLLVVLASSSEATNRLILEAASKSMLNDYVWITSHEWLDSVDRALERLPESWSNEPPSFFLSTKMETFQEHQFKEYFSHLMPALPGPIPRDWFDEFWQQKFQCKLPSARVGANNGDACNYWQRLSWDQMERVDDLVPYTIRAVESLHVALSGLDSDGQTGAEQDISGTRGLKHALEFARDFKLAFDLGTREVVGNTSPSSPNHRTQARAKPLVGFHIVHRLCAKWQKSSLEPRFKSSQRSNDRRPAVNELVRVGLWRDHYQLRQGSKLAMLPFKHNPERNPQQVVELLEDRGPVLRALEGLAANSTQAASSKMPESEADLSRDIAESLNRVAKFESKCRSKAVCKLCRRQIGLTMSIIQQEEARLRLSESGVTGGSALPQPPLSQPMPITKLVSSLDSSNSNFAYDDDEDDDQVGGDEGGSEPNKNGRKHDAAEPLNGAASSLFDARTGQQEADQTRRAYKRREQHQLKSLENADWTNWLPSVQFSTTASNLRRHSQGALLSLVSLLGVAFTVVTMAYFNTSMLEVAGSERGASGQAAQSNLQLTNWPGRVKKFNQSQRSTSSSQCDIVPEDECGDEELNRMWARIRPAPNSFLGSILANVTDYLMLTGLLMLYSINMAFLLPAASVAVCWLRRIGLPLSYTLLFGSILGKVREIHRQSALTEASIEMQTPSTRSGCQARKHAEQAAAIAAKQQHLEPVEESVEVTFESLSNRNAQRNEPALDMVARIHVPEAPSDLVSLQTSPDIEPIERPPQGGSSLKLVLMLMLIQVSGSLAWLYEQPPEPSLHQARSCWHCASPTKSPLMFLYEPLLSLILPVALLAFSWLWSIVVYRRISSSDTRFGRAIRRLIMNQPLSFTQMQNPDYLRLKHKQLELADQLHHSKLLVITTTLLVLLWAFITLSIASNSRTLRRLLTSSGLSGASAKSWQMNGASATNFQHEADDSQSLVCMNLLSGAIVFSVLFVYRLNWLTGCVFATKARKSHYDQISSTLTLAESNTMRRSKSAFRLFRRRNQRGSTTISRPIGQQHNGDSPTEGTGQQQHQQKQEERVKLQHFSMTYGTYSAGTSSGAQATVSTDSTSRPDLNRLPSHRPDSGLPADEEGRKGRKNLDKKDAKSKSIFKLRKSSTGRGSTGSNSKRPTSRQAADKLQRRQSNGSVASSQANLMRRFSDFDLTDNDYDVDDLEVEELSQVSAQRHQHPNQFDTISCAMSVASNSTSQLQGNDLYPIDCSIQLDSQPVSGATPPDQIEALDDLPQQRPAAINLSQVEV